MEDEDLTLSHSVSPSPAPQHMHKLLCPHPLSIGYQFWVVLRVEVILNTAKPLHAVMASPFSCW